VAIGDLKSDAAKNTLAYLDEKIKHWRGELSLRMGEEVVVKAGYIPAEKAISYIDAYQTMRFDLFGEALPDE
jgi:hypothetical protein